MVHGDSRARRGLRWARYVLYAIAIAVVATEALYVVAVNLFLSTPLFDKIVNATPDAVDIHYARGWSIFPTRIHAKQLSIRGTDSHIEWILRLDEVEFECSLRALLRKEFRVTMAHGQGITFRLRFKVESPAATPELQRELPTIDSLGPVGFRPSEAPSGEDWDDTQWHLWTVSIQGANAEHVREVWIEHARFTGDADIKGGFYLKPIRRAEVEPTTVVVRAGNVALDSRVAFDHLVASAKVVVVPFDPRSTDPVLEKVSVEADASLEVPDVDALGLKRDGVSLLSGKVTVPKVALRVVDGSLRDGSVLHAAAKAATVHAPLCAVSGAVEATAEVLHDVLTGRVVASGIHACATVEAPRLEATFNSSELALDAPFGDLHAVVDVPDVGLVDATRLHDVLPKGSAVRVLGGSLHGALHGEVWRKEQRAVGSANLRGKDLMLTDAKLHVRGDVQAKVDVLQWDLESQTGSAKGGVAIEHLTGGFAPVSASPDFVDWKGDLEVADGRLRFEPKLHLETDVTLHARNADPILELLLGDSLSPLIASWTVMPSFTALAHLSVEPHKVAVSDILASGGTLSVRGTTVLRPADAGGVDGAFVVRKDPLSVGLDLDPHGVHLRLFGLDGWYRDRAREVAEPRPALEASR